MSKPFTVQQWLHRYYHFLLLNTNMGEPARIYLESRGITKDIIKTFKLGFAPINVSPTLRPLKGKGFSFNDLIQEKILLQYQTGKYKGKITDPLKGRIIFPIRDFIGNVIGFGGQALDPKNKIKYINSAESSIFIKGNNFYGIDLAVKEIKNQGYVIVFEGYFDTITAYQAGIKNGVSTLGTTLTINQALLLKDMTRNIIVAFDGDKSGIEASIKSASVLEKSGVMLELAFLPMDMIQMHTSKGKVFKHSNKRSLLMQHHLRNV